MGRRLFLAGSTAGLGLLAARCTASDLTLDQAYARLHESDLGLEDDDGLANHGPMASEALDAMGRADAIGEFMDDYEDKLAAAPSGSPLSEDEQAEALGAYGERGRWIATYASLLETTPPFSVFAERWDQLAPGFMAAGLHGVLRVAHALRALSEADNAVRRTELAHGLALWSARHETLPGTPGATAEPGLDVTKALVSVPKITAPSEGLITTRLRAVEGVSEFAAAVEAVDLDALPVASALTELASVCARLFLAAPSPGIVELHGLTGTSAVRLMLPHLSTEQQRSALGYLFQVVAAIFAISDTGASIPPAPSTPDTSADEITSCAADQTDEHVIKLSEVVLREHAVAPRPEFFAAALHALD